MPQFYSKFNKLRNSCESDSNGLVTTRTLDANWKNLLSVTTPVNQTTFTYDSRGNLLTKTKTVEGVSQSWVYTYDSVGRLTSFTHPKTGKTSYTYDASGALTKITNALNHSWTITQNDPHGRPLSITTPSGEVATYLYDAAGRLTQQTLTYPDKSNHATVFTYTSRGKLATITRPDGYVTTFTYNVADFLTAITDSLGNKIAYTLEGAGRPVSATYTQQGVVISKQNYTYDTLTGEIASITDGLGKKTTYAYDASGRVIQETDALNRQKLYQHHALGSALEYSYSGTNPNFVSGGRVDFTYDLLGSLTSVRTPDAQETLYTVDGFGLVKNRQSGSTGQDQYLYHSCVYG